MYSLWTHYVQFLVQVLDTQYCQDTIRLPTGLSVNTVPLICNKQQCSVKHNIHIINIFIDLGL